MEKEKVVNYSDTEKLIVKALVEADGKELTLAELSAIVGKELKSGNINALVKKGNVACTPANREVEYVAKKKVATYGLIKGLAD